VPRAVHGFRMVSSPIMAAVYLKAEFQRIG
jgi:hypothetical protein